MSQTTVQAFPTEVTRDALTGLLDEMRNRDTVLQAVVRRFERRYGTLEALEARLERGEGPEHPDWEDSIEWRNAVEALQRTRLARSLFEWLLRSKTLSLAS